MIHHLQEFLMERRAEWNLPAAGEWSFLFHNNYHPNSSNINLLWFHKGTGFPRVVTKLYREPAILKREFGNLTRVHSSAPTWTPKPLHFGLQGDFWALWMEGVPGFSFRPRSAKRVVASAVEMLASIHGALKGGADPRLDRYARVALEPLQTVTQFGNSTSVGAGCARLAAQLSSQWIESLPVMPQHGDLVTENVLVHGDQAHVVDWETLGRIDLPFYDLFTFLFSLLNEEGDMPEAWDRALMNETPALIKQYAKRLGLLTADIPLLLPLALVNWFHLQWCDGHLKFAGRMYKVIEHHFEHPELWHRAFVSQ
jgi:hypothetical protein